MPSCQLVKALGGLFEPLQSVHLLPHIVEVRVLQGLLRRDPLRWLVLQHFLQQTNTSKNSNLCRYKTRMKSTEPSA
jgi:hypothetical protein